MEILPTDPTSNSNIQNDIKRLQPLTFVELLVYLILLYRTIP
jgi:hypothetical protein